jgi:hypothetical protein
VRSLGDCCFGDQNGARLVARGRDDGVENLAFMIDGDATEGVAYGSRRQISGQSVHQNRTVS